MREFADLLEQRGCVVKYAVHPVAGRMPGHINMLLAEASVPFDCLYDIDAIHFESASAVVALVVGANDVRRQTRPAESDHGMPVLNAEDARTVIVLKRSMNPGCAKIQNELFLRSNPMMLFGDAKKTLTELIGGLKEIGWRGEN